MSPFIIILIQIVTIVTSGQRPNILLVLTDDQDVYLDSMKSMVKTDRALTQKGTTFTNAFVNTPICCPSRATFLTGQYLHNTGTFNNSISGQCGGEEWIKKETEDGFAPKMQAAGYETIYLGKYMNMYGLPAAGGVEQVPAGWDHWYGQVGNSKYYNYTLSVNGKEEKHGDNYSEDYHTDLIYNRSLAFLNDRDTDKPFLMVLAPPASHAPFTPAPQYETEFSDIVAPRLPSFNVDSGDTKHWFTRQGGNLSSSAVVEVDKVFRNRWRTLLSVDDMVEGLVTRLEQENLINNTYIMYTSDHGYHLGEFGMPIDKRQPYEFDIRVPFILRGPEIAANTRSEVPILMVDVAPTLLDIAGVPDDSLDGVSILKRKEVTRRFLVEYSGEGGEGVDKACSQWNTGEFSWCKVELDCKCQDTYNNTYTCLRSFTSTGQSLFCQFADNEQFEEYYDLDTDPWQLSNLAMTMEDEERDQQRFMLLDLAECKGQECQKWNSDPIISRANSAFHTLTMLIMQMTFLLV